MSIMKDSGQWTYLRKISQVTNNLLKSIQNISVYFKKNIKMELLSFASSRTGMRNTSAFLYGGLNGLKPYVSHFKNTKKSSS